MGKLEVRKLNREGEMGIESIEVFVFIVFASGIRFGERKIDSGGIDTEASFLLNS